MCGIVGILHHDPAHPVPADRISQMCAAIRHRGPDDEGTYVEGPVGLGMRRLSIIDLEGGHQPIANEDGSARIVLNGEIYNYRILQQALKARGHRFRTASDTETILHLYEEEGVRCVEALRGMFAFAIWDGQRRQLLIARDRFGIKPLYYTVDRRGIAFASELKALLAVGASDRRLDWEGLDAYFELGYLPTPYTPFVDVRKLPPAHTLVWRPGLAPVISRYWDLPSAVHPAPRDPASRVRECLDDAVAAHLVSDVPVAAFLSGGLDSSAVVSSMALQGVTPHAYIARYHGTGAEASDEVPLAEALARRYGAQLTPVDIVPQVDDIIGPIVQALDEPHADDSAIPSWLLSQAVGADYKVALTGIGGDELFAGYRRHRGLRWSAQYARIPSAIRGLIARWADGLGEPSSATLTVDRIKRFAHAGEGAAAARFLAMVGRLRWEERSRLYQGALGATISGRSAARVFEAHADLAPAERALATALYLDYKTFLPDDILALSDRLSMAHGLEIRVPFVDHQFVESIFPLSDRSKLGWGRSKALLRRALRPRLPSAHFTAPKRGFVGPTASWLRHELRPLLRDELSPSRLARLGHFDPAMVQRLLNDHFTGRHNREGILWALLCFSLWHRTFCEAGATSTGEPLRAGRRSAATSRG
jgi:asparagine synthase (glutamine-hydrolysing)